MTPATAKRDPPNAAAPEARAAKSKGPRSLGAAGTFRLEAPRLRTTGDPREERHATWFELFFDLVFVAAVGQLGMAVARHPSAAGFARFASLFVIVVWAWVLYALYANRFDTDDLVFRLGKAGAMFAVAVVAVNLRQMMEGHGGSAAFAIAYVVLRLFLIALYFRARHHLEGSGRKLSEIYIVGYSATTLIWFVSIAVPAPWRYVLWGVAMCVDLAIPTRAWAALKGTTVVVSHLTDRFGTFFIIVLGTSVVGAVTGIAGLEFTLASWTTAAACFAIALALWWIYFDLADTSVVGRGALGLVYVYSHFPLLAGVAAFGAGTKLAVSEAARPALHAGARWALAGGIGTFALALAVIHVGAEWTSLRDRTFIGRLALAAIAFVLAATASTIAPAAFAVILAAVTLGQLLLEAFTPRGGAASIVE
jgi:low temperature requirement protein LtrA